MQGAAGVLAGGLPSLGLGVHPAPAADDPLDMLGRAGAPDREQPRLGLRGRHAGELAHLGVRQLAPGERLAQQWEGAEGAGDADVLAGGARAEPHAPGQPGGAGAEAVAPAAAGVELADQVEQARGGGVEVRRQLGDLVTQSIQLGGGRTEFHERVPLVLGRLYTRVFGSPWSVKDGRSRHAP